MPSLSLSTFLPFIVSLSSFLSHVFGPVSVEFLLSPSCFRPLATHGDFK